jgi:myo-inositol 2-dehydrogenase / D-chiro-inositol 1-dehydrogenase
MKIGIAGAGRIGVAHAEVLAANPDVTELIVADVDASRATSVANKLGASVAATFDELLTADVAGVVIATSTSTHADLVVAAAEAGVTIFCEKPIALDIPSTRRVLDCVTAKEATVQVGFHRRFNEGYANCHRSLQAGELGELRRVHLHSVDPAPSDSEMFIRTSGGIARDLHIHDFDTLRWVTGREVVEVYACGANRGAAIIKEVGDVDESVLLLVLDDDTLVTAQGSRYNGAGFDVRMEVAGTRDTCVVGWSDRTPVRSAEPGAEFPAGEHWYDFYERFASAYVAQFRAFVDLAAGRRDSPCTVTDALQTLYIAEAAERSRLEHRPVLIEEVVASASA